jgi:hypothetical protein
VDLHDEIIGGRVRDDQVTIATVGHPELNAGKCIPAKQPQPILEVVPAATGRKIQFKSVFRSILAGINF